MDREAFEKELDGYSQEELYLIYRTQQDVYSPEEIEMIGARLQAVPEAVTEELKVLQTLLDQAMKLGGFDSETLNAFKARVAFFERLIDFGTATTFIHRKKTRRKPKKEQEFKKG